jgi:hypothetical protein
MVLAPTERAPKTDSSITATQEAAQVTTINNRKSLRRDPLDEGISLQAVETRFDLTIKKQTELLKAEEEALFILSTEYPKFANQINKLILSQIQREAMLKPEERVINEDGEWVKFWNELQKYLDENLSLRARLIPLITVINNILEENLTNLAEYHKKMGEEITQKIPRLEDNGTVAERTPLPKPPLVLLETGHYKA